MGGSSAAVGVVGGVPGGAHQATVTTVDQTQIITLQVLFFHFIFVFCFSCLFLFVFGVVVFLFCLLLLSICGVNKASRLLI